MFNKRVKVKELLALEPTNQEITVMGWVRSFRNNQFMALNDGSTNNNIQVVLELGKYDEATLKRITTSASVKVTGILIPSLGKGQKSEVKATTLEILGAEGKRVYTEVLKSSTGVNVYDFNSKVQLPHGIYFVSLTQGNTRTEAVRIVKK